MASNTEDMDSWDRQKEELSLSDAASFLLDECRMVLPGIQALLGFQLIAVFSPGFDQKLSVPDQHIHLAAITLLAIAVALIMTPAAYNRHTGLREVTQTFIRVSTRLLLASMLPLAVGVCLDYYLIAKVLLDGLPSALVASGLFALFMLLWFVLPRAKGLQRLLGRDR
ncbi:MAG TPA: DUF6328 family protein [Candidatus Kapabacteria bacterium]|nr:DUF6328 family protein [Candidatus Kapabacteria bacterium]